MAKFYGAVGYYETVESPAGSGVWVEDVFERFYTGDIVRNIRRIQPGEHLNDDISVSNEVRILADAYAYEHFHTIRYVHWHGTKWKIRDVEVARPRLILRLGEVYHSPSPDVVA